jgi:hypothetical protein
VEEKNGRQALRKKHASRIAGRKRACLAGVFVEGGEDFFMTREAPGLNKKCLPARFSRAGVE